MEISLHKVVCTATILLLSLFQLSAQCNELCDDPNANTFFGTGNGASNTGTLNTFYGRTAGRDNTSGEFNSFFGAGAGLNNTTADDNSFFGRHAGLRTTTGSDNAFFGSDAGEMNTTGIENTFFGASAGSSNTTGNFNAFFGKGAGESNTTGLSNTFFGATSGQSNITGNFNTFFGINTGFSNTTGGSNAFFGTSAGFSNTAGDANAFFGRSAGSFIQGSNNISLGFRSGPPSGSPNVTRDSVLYIDVEFSDDPLIYGEFDNDFVRINGSFEVTAGLTNPSSRKLKTNFESIEGSEILSQVASLNIQKWNYKSHPKDKHLGPVAEDFYAAFGLGAGDQQISTIDADGVALAAIQALYKKITEVEKENTRLRSAIERLEKR